MKRHHILMSVLTVFCLIGFSAAAQAQKNKPKPETKPEKTAPKPEKPKAFNIVQIGDEYKVVEATEVASIRKKADQDFKTATEGWNTAKKDAAKSKAKFTDPKPKKPAVKTVGKTFPSSEAANTFLEELKSKANKKKG